MEELANVSIDAWPIAAVCVLVLLDIVSGLGKAYVTGTLSSKAMRDGLMHKATYFGLIVLFVAVEVFQQHFDVLTNVPTTLAICVYVCVTEFVSVLENLTVINPELREWPVLSKLFEKDLE